MFVQKEVFHNLDIQVEIPEWPPLSPDLNPIEQVWSLCMIEHRKVLNFSRKPKNPVQTFSLIQKAWDQIDNYKVIKIL